ncbi:YwqJ-related putative deaminase [Plectonema radiosum NIES-515]|uniref:YwqJ-related putative deaminase n=1 Tax=Plectonema radiosum NIES-515 TaxID=2986073 RepID=A0ABT3ATJ1_9CYAN|nr:YwqJ-related putative deaminase [Plectonema radiosum]MCV3212365.1 YwqJ-related putative deaminase [Plectonema radiosum NIES-515]
MSSLDACAANPECAAAISSEVAPAVSAPTGAGFGASTLSTTTAAGATTSSVQGVAEISVAARLGTLGILYYWNQSQNEKAQEKAKKKYCTTYPNDSEVCTHWKIRGVAYTAPDYPDCPYAYSEKFIDVPYGVTPHLEIVQTNGYPWGCKSALLAKIPEIDYFDQITQWQSLQGLDKVEVNKSWSDWSQEKRDEAVRLLNGSDWQGLINSMPQAGILNPGDKINAPTIVIPGEETDDPNTPADERLLRKEHGFFTFPGKNDFDYDADGTADSADPEPQNPSVPTASDNSSGSSSDQSPNPPNPSEPLDTSQEPRPAPLSEISEGIQAKDFAEAKAAELRDTLPKRDIPRATAAAVNTKTGKVYYGTSGKPLPTTIDEYLAERMPSPSLEPWEVSNCAEFKAVNNALLDGANVEDLEVHTVRTKTGEAFPRCQNCRVTTDGTNVTSDP